MSDQDTLIGTIRKNSAEEVRVAVTEFKGGHYVDVRVFAAYGDDADEERRATKKGVTLNLTKLPELIDALEMARVEAERLGLLDGARP